jgi:hypothetical protein
VGWGMGFSSNWRYLDINNRRHGQAEKIEIDIKK